MERDLYYCERLFHVQVASLRIYYLFVPSFVLGVKWWLLFWLIYSFWQGPSMFSDAYNGLAATQLAAGDAADALATARLVLPHHLGRWAVSAERGTLGRWAVS